MLLGCWACFACMMEILQDSVPLTICPTLHVAMSSIKLAISYGKNIYVTELTNGHIHYFLDYRFKEMMDKIALQVKVKSRLYIELLFEKIFFTILKLLSVSAIKLLMSLTK